MSKLFKFVQKFAIGFFAVCFVFVALYTPQIYTPKTVEAVFCSNCSQIWLQKVEEALQGLQYVQDKISAAANTVISTMSQAMNYKEFTLDGIAWALAKSIVSKITSSIVKWVNSGFKGSPAFVTNFKETMLAAMDEGFGDYMKYLGGPFSFVCSPFKLDVQVAMEAYYKQIRLNDRGGNNKCTLTGALTNIENFVSGNKTFLESGGWDTWFAITTNPRVTPYGSILEGKAQVRAVMENKRGEKLWEIDSGQGFLSAKVCETVADESGGHQRCTITTPGKVINEALTFQTSAGPRSLIEADEFNEILAAVFAQLAEKAITGAAGLLGLSGGTGYTQPAPSGQTYTDYMNDNSLTMDSSELMQEMEKQLDLEKNFKNNALTYETLLLSQAADARAHPDSRTAAQDAANEIRPLLLEDIDKSITGITDILLRMPAALDNSQALADLFREYRTLPVHTETAINNKIAFWQSILDNKIDLGAMVGTNPPTSLFHTCLAGNTQVSLNWQGPAGATSYGVRLNDSSNDATACPGKIDGWYCPASKDNINDYYEPNSIILSINPGVTYSWWVHSIAGTSWGDSVGATFTCP